MPMFSKLWADMQPVYHHALLFVDVSLLQSSYKLLLLLQQTNSVA
jgi:hypothetical protein